MEIPFTERDVEALQQEAVAWRRHLHQYPELSFQERETSQYIVDTLQAIGGMELSRPTPTSVVARLVGDRPGRVVALRADIDALPIQEENDFAFTSKQAGVMHACGHDGHTAMLLAVAKLFAAYREAIVGEVLFIFQHAEELPPGGAEELVEAGVLDDVDVVIGTHLWASLDVGKVGVIHGPAMAAADRFEITVQGQGGHAAGPHNTIDSIAIGAQVVSNLQHVVSRNTDPLNPVVLSVTKFVGGNSFNIIPGTVQIAGTVRTLDNDVREQVPTLMERVIKGITEAHGAGYDFTYDRGYRPLINQHDVTRFVEETAKEVMGADNVERLRPSMGGEDFSAYLQRVPGTYFFTGAGNSEKGISYPHHHPRFTIDEDALLYGIHILARSAWKLLHTEKNENVFAIL
ncbi:M20 family metallopeptidase [Desmospora activa]|uniref:Amidohydrolase n=1 Tax=Desmospora activa DSM 45169 TaxID=1121389 RepID=A0A2T4Z8T5_9BACL|nr:M20 family metallopeptidase [Desmospora activa]PTM58302.1 amidohydrolase [Desmospora activa DSM 45169]